APPPEQVGIQPKSKIVLPDVKDDTDNHYAARWLLEQGYTDITLLGALGGARMEHTFANIATGLYLAKHGVHVLLASPYSELHYLLPGHPLALQDRDAGGRWQYLSLFPLEGTLRGVDIGGVYYPLHGATLTAEYPLGVSNEFTAPTATLQCQAGSGLAVLTRADG
ncbi:MAG: thiamine diphosphokinase, partial [Gemmiger sp.]|nr:thiamine diphosphokinase [Gemmiger sp.]